ncbi:MAG: TetR/AcrR family transcriptional regulator, partial [Clostridia bacterium]|nr:TetR/AcrR family transcriptional regulator [Clostridia bacterium]
MTQREEREENMQRVVWAAQALFIKQGFAATTISQIAREVSLSEMSIYRYFQNKGNLVERVWRESLTIFFKEFMEELERVVNDGMTGLEQFGVCMDLYIRYYTQFPEFLNYTREMFIISNQN